MLASSPVGDGKMAFPHKALNGVGLSPMCPCPLFQALVNVCRYRESQVET